MRARPIGVGNQGHLAGPLALPPVRLIPNHGCHTVVRPLPVPKTAPLTPRWLFLLLPPSLLSLLLSLLLLLRCVTFRCAALLPLWSAALQKLYGDHTLAPCGWPCLSLGSQNFVSLFYFYPVSHFSLFASPLLALCNEHPEEKKNPSSVALCATAFACNISLAACSLIHPQYTVPCLMR